MFTKEFGLAAFERAIKTFAQTLVAIVGVAGLGLHEVDWVTALSVAGLAALASVLTSVVSAGPGPTADGESNAPTAKTDVNLR